MFFTQSKLSGTKSTRDSAFSYLPNDTCYFDSACQTMRPQCVIDAENDYYLHTNACGGRVKYQWGSAIDRKVQEARSLLLQMVGKSPSEYAVAFTLNTTYGINLVLHQLPGDTFDSMITSDIEHNSVVLPTMSCAKRHGMKRLVLPRAEDGSLLYQKKDLEKSIVLINTVSNIDGRIAKNLSEIASDVHASGGLLLLDAAQGFAHDVDRLRDTDFDAVFGSGHKMYGPSIGFIILKRSLLDRLEPFFIGGGTVTDVTQESYTLLRTGEDAHSVLEIGLQNWAGILGLRTAIQWQNQYRRDSHTRAVCETDLAKTLFIGLQQLPRISLINKEPSPIVSFSVEGLDSHQLALYLDAQKIMCRSGYFCCHSYLLYQRKLPPLLRVSLGLHTTDADIEKFLRTMKTILETL